MWTYPGSFTSRPERSHRRRVRRALRRALRHRVRAPRRGTARSRDSSSRVIMLVGAMLFDSGVSDDLRIANMGFACTSSRRPRCASSASPSLSKPDRSRPDPSACGGCDNRFEPRRCRHGDGNGRPLHDHLGRLPRRGEPRDLPLVPGGEVRRRLRRLARQVQEPVPRPPGRWPRPQLGQRAPACRPARGRPGRRGAVPQHRSPVLPELRAVRAPAAPRPARAPTGRDPRAQPMVGRLVRRAPERTRRDRSDLPQRRRRGRQGPPLHQGARPARRRARRGRSRPTSTT